MQKKRGILSVSLYRKSQISIFIIIGLVLLILFILMMLLFSGDSTGIETAEKTQKNIFQSESMIRYTETCLKDKFQESLDLIGRQGGYIYKEQPGSKIPFEIESYIYDTGDFTENIAILMLPLDRLPPSYPCYTDENMHDNPSAYCGFIYDKELFPDLNKYNYGKSRLQKLYKKHGIYSIQSQIEHYVEDRIQNCTNFKEIEEDPRFQQYKITELEPDAEIRIDDNSVTAVLNYPLKFEIPGIRSEKKVLKFAVTEDVRLKLIYEAVRDMINKDNSYLDYEIYEDTRSGFFRGKELKFNRIKHEADIEVRPINENLELIKVTDEMSSLKAKPYFFQFIRKNRNPVLDYIPKEFPPNKVADIAVLEGESIEIDPEAIDPDGLNIIYTYHGWRQDYYTEWDDYNRVLIMKDWNSESGVRNVKSGLPDSSLSYENIVLYDKGERPVNSFTVNAWFKTDENHEIDNEIDSYHVQRVYPGVNGQKYLFWPDHGGMDGDENGAGVSVGTNGISVYEHSHEYMPALAVYEGDIGSGWNHLVLVYDNKVPKIYLNGNLVKTGLVSGKDAYCPHLLGGTSYGFFNGNVDEVAVWDKTFSSSAVRNLYEIGLSKKRLDEFYSDMIAYYPTKNGYVDS